MAFVRASGGERREEISGWEWRATAADAAATPADLPADGWDAFAAPGTINAALRSAGRLTDEVAHALDEQDHWLRTTLSAPLSGRLRFDGLATICEVWLAGEKRADSVSMFLPVEIEADLPAGAEIALCFRAFAPRLAAAPRRSRWRPQMIQPNGLRHFRTTALGSTPGWSPAGRPKGPYRPIWRIERTGPQVRSVDVRARYEDGVARLAVAVAFSGSAPMTTRLRCAGQEIELVGDGDRRHAELLAPDAAPWFPHTHGEPALYPVTLEMDGVELDLGRVGFRSITIDRDVDGQGFGIVVNDLAVFCRGACWSSADAIALPATREAYEPWLRLARDAGMNMIRVPGVMVYETNDFFELCDELGLMVWQDAMLANFDYPQNDLAFREAVRAEAESFLDRTQTSPSLTVFCGGSEVFQQAAMLGAPAEVWAGPIFDDALPSVLTRTRPDVAYVPNSPSGGALPFSANAGVTHYYGVGAYLRDLDDARRSEVRFASESLAFSNVPESVSLVACGLAPVTHGPEWKRGVPRDVGASWDFEDVREHYVQRLYGADAPDLKRSDPGRYVALSCAATAEVMEATFAEFRRPGSPTRGALVWLLQDLMPGAGWGVIASDGLPKAAYHALKRAFRPVQISMTDEGVNGLGFHVINERATPLVAEITLTCWRDGTTPVVRASTPVALAPREAKTLSAYDLIGSFFDVAYAYRFGPPGHDATSIALTEPASGTVLAEAFHFPLGRGLARHALGLTAGIETVDDERVLVLSSERFAQSVHIETDGWAPEENWFHLAPGVQKRVKLVPQADAPLPPSGFVRALNAVDEVRFTS